MKVTMEVSTNFRFCKENIEFYVADTNELYNELDTIMVELLDRCDIDTEETFDEIIDQLVEYDQYTVYNLNRDASIRLVHIELYYEPDEDEILEELFEGVILH